MVFKLLLRLISSQQEIVCFILGKKDVESSNHFLEKAFDSSLHKK